MANGFHTQIAYILLTSLFRTYSAVCLIQWSLYGVFASFQEPFHDISRVIKGSCKARPSFICRPMEKAVSVVNRELAYSRLWEGLHALCGQPHCLSHSRMLTKSTDLSCWMLPSGQQTEDTPQRTWQGVIQHSMICSVNCLHLNSLQAMYAVCQLMWESRSNLTDACSLI